MKMTIEEAIRHLKDLSKCEIYLWSKDIQAIDIAVKALEENKRMKELLKLSVEDFGKINLYISKYPYSTYHCVLNCDDCPYAITLQGCKWKHYSEAIELLKVK